MIKELDSELFAVFHRCCAVLWLWQCAPLVCRCCVSNHLCCLCHLYAETVVSLHLWGFFAFEIWKCWKFTIPLLSYRKAGQKTRAMKEDSTYMSLQKTHPTSEYDVIHQLWLICWILNSVSKWWEHILIYIILWKCTFEDLLKFDIFKKSSYFWNYWNYFLYIKYCFSWQDVFFQITWK